MIKNTLCINIIKYLIVFGILYTILKLIPSQSLSNKKNIIFNIV